MAAMALPLPVVLGGVTTMSTVSHPFAVAFDAPRNRFIVGTSHQLVVLPNGNATAAVVSSAGRAHKQRAVTHGGIVCPGGAGAPVPFSDVVDCGGMVILTDGTIIAACRLRARLNGMQRYAE